MATPEISLEGDFGEAHEVDLRPAVHAAVDELLYVDREGWYDVMENIGDYFNGFGDRTPAALKAELQKITAQLA